MTEALMAGGVLLFALGNVTGFYACRTLIEWRKAKVSMKHAWPFLQFGSAAVIILAIVCGAYLKMNGWLG